MTGMLSPYRVLDLADERGLIAGMILADLGADVIAVEPPAGSPARRPAPRRGGQPPGDSLWWEGYARNRRGVAFDLESAAGRQQFLDLAATADVVIESFAPGYLAAQGLGYDDLARLDPGLILVSITPFGQSGPKAHWPAVDLTVVAASNYLYSCGDEDRAPLRIAVPQGFLHAGADAAVAALIALHERERSGRGQWVDISAQASAAFCTLSANLAAGWNDRPTTRMGGGLRLGMFPLRLTYPAKDGYVNISFYFGSAVGPATRRLMEWIYEAGECDEALRDKDWIGLGALLMSGKEPFSEFIRAQETVAAFTSKRTKAELFAEARRRRVLLVPMSTVADLHHDPHLAAREYWRPPAPGLDGPRLPGPFAKFSGAPIVYRYPAPATPGQDNASILAGLPAAEPAPVSPGPARGPALAGLKVIDLTWVMVGPSSMRVLADYGATVVKVESTTRVDTARTIAPFKDQQPGAERSAVYANYNAGKLGFTLNLATEEGRGVLKRLVAWADVIAEAFTPRVMRGWGLDYETLRAINPRLIYLSTSLGGATGPYSDVAGFGNLGAGLAGFTNLVGWPDRPPAGPAGAYTDYITPRFIVASILAAISHRDRTGEGQYIDISQAEASIHFLTPAVLDFDVNGHVLTPRGNRADDMAPHGVFRCKGEDRWVALAAATDAHWQALVDLVGPAAFPPGARDWDLAARQADETAIEAAIEAWTIARDPYEAEAALIAAGIPAHIVADHEDTFADPQLLHRGHFIRVPHAELGEVWLEGSRFQLSATPATVRSAGPVYGQHNDVVLRDILGLDDEAIAALVEAGALQ
jgi:crotonobetainyl-CoA:carnitine CoA-transferase CaiB-like acyl-CoA transferase